MRCSHCGQPLEGTGATCTRCGAANDSATRRHDVLVSLVVAAAALVFVAALVYVVLGWYGSQQAGMA